MGRLAPLSASLLVVVLAGCGSSTSSSTTVGGEPSAGTAKAVKAAANERRAAEAKAPKGASPTLRAIYATFSPPKPDPGVKYSAAAIKAGERACRGKSPLQVKEEFYPAAAIKLEPEQRQMIGRIASFESSDSKDASFTAGQLAADVYGATLSAASSQYGYEGCIYLLAGRLERELGPRK